MKVIVFVKASKSSEAGVMPTEQLIREMTAFNEELVKAGVMLAGEGLKPSSQATRVRFSGKNRTVIDGPFAETKELVAGFWIWQVKSMQEAIEWVKRCPNPMPEDSEIEIRPFFSPEDFGPEFTPELQQREEAMRKSVEGYAVSPSRFENGPAMTIAGSNASYTKETAHSGIADQWMKFAPHIGQVSGQVDKNAYGVVWNGKGPCEFDYLCGVEVSSSTKLPAEFKSVELKPQRYAVFTHHEHYSKLPALLEAIWTKWLPNSGYTPAQAPFFERYSEEFNPETGKGGTEVWIPLQA